MNENQDIFETLSTSEKIASDLSHPVHTNTHNHALVENPFAWEDDQAETED